MGAQNIFHAALLSVLLASVSVVIKRVSWHYLKRTSTLNLKTSACLNRLRKLSLQRTTTGVVPSRGSSSLGYLKKFNLDPGPAQPLWLFAGTTDLR
jgi:hypothetical protein